MNRELEEIVANVDGWLFPKEGQLLFRLARDCRGDGVIVEIGSWQGKSTILLAKGAECGSQCRIYAIDPHVGSTEHRDGNETIWTYDKFKENLERAGVSENVSPIVKFSHEATRDVNEQIELLFIDGAHDYDSVMQDFRDWSPKLMVGGVIAFHDTLGWSGPKQVVREEVIHSHCFKDVKFTNSITYATKVDQNSWFDRVRSKVVWYWHGVYDLLFRIVSWPPIKRLILRFRG